MTCWSMWTKKSSSSSGISCAAAASVIPSAKLACRHLGTGCAAGRERPGPPPVPERDDGERQEAVKAVIAPY